MPARRTSRSPLLARSPPLISSVWPPAACMVFENLQAQGVLGLDVDMHRVWQSAWQGPAGLEVVAPHCPGRDQGPRSERVRLLRDCNVGRFLLRRTIYSYTVVVMSNQGGINLQPDSKSAKSDSRRLTNFKDKVAAVLGQLDMPITVYAATGQDQYRKPRPGMWKQMQIDYDLCSSEALDLGQSFFVGDAGGRLATKGSKNDHANSDRCANPHFSEKETRCLRE